MPTITGNPGIRPHPPFYIFIMQQIGTRFGLLCTAGILAVFGAIAYFLAPGLVGLFNSDPEIIRYGAGRTMVCAFFYCLCGFSHTASAVMRGLGKPMTPMVVILLSEER